MDVPALGIIMAEASTVLAGDFSTAVAIVALPTPSTRSSYTRGISGSGCSGRASDFFIPERLKHLFAIHVTARHEEDGRDESGVGVLVDADERSVDAEFIDELGDGHVLDGRSG